MNSSTPMQLMTRTRKGLDYVAGGFACGLGGVLLAPRHRRPEAEVHRLNQLIQPFAQKLLPSLKRPKGLVACRPWVLEGVNNPVLLCVTDALGHWLLEDFERGGSGGSQLAEMRSIDQLESLVHAERASKAMRVDDTTLAVIRFGTSARPLRRVCAHLHNQQRRQKVCRPVLA